MAFFASLGARSSPEFLKPPVACPINHRQGFTEARLWRRFVNAEGEQQALPIDHSGKGVAVRPLFSFAGQPERARLGDGALRRADRGVTIEGASGFDVVRPGEDKPTRNSHPGIHCRDPGLRGRQTA